jgi:integrase
MARASRPWFRKSKGTWYCTLDGKKVSLKVRGRENENDAVMAWHRLFANGTPEPVTTHPPTPEPQPEAKAGPEADGVTVGEVLTAFLADCQGRLKPKALHDYRAFLTAFAAHFGVIEATALTTAMAEQYARKPTWSGTTQHDFLGILASAFKWAERVRLIERTPLLGLKKPPKASRGAKSVVSAETVQTLICYSDARSDTEFAALLRFLWLTGCRPSEAANLTADAVHWAECCAVLEEHKTAHRGKFRVIYLSAEALAVPRQQQAEHPRGFLFRRPSGGRSTTSASPASSAGRAGWPASRSRRTVCDTPSPPTPWPTAFLTLMSPSCWLTRARPCSTATTPTWGPGRRRCGMLSTGFADAVPLNALPSLAAEPEGARHAG